jgi:hypothetical protein
MQRKSSLARERLITVMIVGNVVVADRRTDRHSSRAKTICVGAPTRTRAVRALSICIASA